MFLLFFVLSCSPVSDSPESDGLGAVSLRKGRIGTRISESGENEFFDNASGKQYIPRGYNYTDVRTFLWNGKELTGHCTFNTDVYSAEESEELFLRLKEGGYNTVRTFLNPVSMADNDGMLDPDYCDNLADFIIRADRYNISLILTIDMIPLMRYETELNNETDIWWWNHQYLFLEQIELETQFWKDLVNELIERQIPLEAIFAYAIRNEFFFHPDYYLFDSSYGKLTLASGNQYDTSSERNALLNDAFEYWIHSVRTAIRELDSQALVTVGFYGPEPLGTPSAVAIANSEIDFVDLHMYPDSYSAEEYADYFELSLNSEKLIIMGEFGLVEQNWRTLSAMASLLDDWRFLFCHQYGIDGWLIWSWTTRKGAELSVPDDGTLFNFLSPASF